MENLVDAQEEEEITEPPDGLVAVQVTPPREPAQLLCRRCHKIIPPGEPGNLVRRQRNDAEGLSPLVMMVISCTGCLKRGEVGYQTDPDALVPPVRLTAGELDTLRAVAANRVYRATRGGTKLFKLAEAGGTACYHDQQVTSLGYGLYRHRLIDWAAVPEELRSVGTPTAWAVVTLAGERHLVADSPENEDEELGDVPETSSAASRSNSSGKRRVSDREIKVFVTAAHRGRAFTSEGGLYLERIGSWESGRAEHIRRDPAARAALEAGYVTRDETTGKFDSTTAGRKKYGLVPTAAHAAAELAARKEQP